MAAQALPTCGCLRKNAAGSLQPQGHSLDKHRECFYGSFEKSSQDVPIGRFELYGEHEELSKEKADGSLEIYTQPLDIDDLMKELE